jgi:hypothetical protein
VARYPITAVADSAVGGTVAAGAAFARGGVVRRQNGSKFQQINRADNVPYLAGASKTKSGLPVNIDSRVPRTLTVKGRTFSPDKYLAIHELAEYPLMRRGIAYEVAHRVALHKERAAVEADGLDWNGYQEQMQKIAEQLERAPHPRIAPLLYTKPYSHYSQGVLNKEEAQERTKGYAEGGTVTADPPGEDVTDQFAGQDTSQIPIYDPSEGPQGEDVTDQFAGKDTSNIPIWQPTPPPNDYGFTRKLAESVAPAGGALAGAVAGAGLGTAAGALAGPLAPIAVPAGELIGGLAGAMVGSEAVSKAQDWVMDKLGISNKEGREQFQQEHPYQSMVAELAPNLAAFNPLALETAGAGALKKAVVGRGLGASIGGGIEAGQEELNDQNFDPYKIALAAGGGALMSGPLTSIGKRIAIPSANLTEGAISRLPTAVQARMQAGLDAARPGRPNEKPNDKTAAAASAATEATAAEPVTNYVDKSQPPEPNPSIAAGGAAANDNAQRPGTNAPENVAKPPAELEDTTTKTLDSIQEDQKDGNPSRNNQNSLGIAAIQAGPDLNADVGNEHSISTGGNRLYAKTPETNVHPSSQTGENPGEILDARTGNIAPDVQVALEALTNKPEEGPEPIIPTPPPVPTLSPKAPADEGPAPIIPTPPPIPTPQAQPERIKQEAHPVPSTPPPPTPQAQPERIQQEAQPASSMSDTLALVNKSKFKADIPTTPRFLKAYQDGYDAGLGRQTPNATDKGAGGIYDRGYNDGRAEANKKDAETTVAPTTEDKGSRILRPVGEENEGFAPIEKVIPADRSLKTPAAEKAPPTEGVHTGKIGEENKALQNREKAAAQSAFDKFAPDTAKPTIPTTKEDRAAFIQRLKDAVAHATEQNGGVNPASKRNSPNDAPSMTWLKAANALANLKRPPAARFATFAADEAQLRKGVSATETKQAGKLEKEIKAKPTKVTGDVTDTALTPEEEFYKNNPEFRPETGETTADEEDREANTLGAYKPSLEDSDRVAGHDELEDVRGLFGRLIRDEEGGVYMPQVVSKFLDGLKGKLGAKNQQTAQKIAAVAPSKDWQAYVGSLSDELNVIDKRDDNTRYNGMLEAMKHPEEMRNATTQQQIFDAKDEGKLASLPQKTQDYVKQWLQPIWDRIEALDKRARELNPKYTASKADNYQYRIAIGKHPAYGGDPVSGVEQGKGLNRTSSQMQDRNYFAIENTKTGERTVVSPTDKGYTKWDKYKKTEMDNSTFPDQVGEKFKEGPDEYTLKDATLNEIEANAMFANGRPALYEHNAMISAYEALANMENTVRHLEFTKGLTDSDTPRGKQFLQYVSTKATTDTPQQTTFPPFRKYFMPDRMRYMFDDYAKAPSDFSPYEKLNRNVQKLLFWIPIPHMMNEGAQFTMARGLDWLNPASYARLGNAVQKAISSVHNQDNIQQDLYKLGYGLKAGVMSREFSDTIARAAGKEMEVNPKMQGFAKALDLDPQKLAKLLQDPVYRPASKMMWASHDMMFTTLVLENEAKGMARPEAAAAAAKFFPTYRIPSILMEGMLGKKGGRAAQQIATSPLFAFGRYHWDIWHNTYANNVKDLIHGTQQEKLEAAGRFFIMGLMGFGVYPLLDKLAQTVTGNPKAEANRRGPMTIPHHFYKAMQGIEDPAEAGRLALSLSPLTSTLSEAYNNRDFAGRQIMETGDVHKAFNAPTVGGKVKAGIRVGVEEGEHLARGLVPPYGTFAQNVAAHHNVEQAVRDQLMDIREPSSQSIKYENTAAAKNDAAATRRAREGKRGPLEAVYNKLTQ